MADLIPDAQAGQGAAARGGGGSAPDYRQLQRPEQGIPPYHLRGNTGTAAEALARTFHEFQNIGLEVTSKLRAKQGAEEGAAAGTDPNFQPKTGLAAITAYGSAYDAAAHVSYVNGTHAQLENAFSKAEQDNAGDPVAFQQHAEAVTKAIVENAPKIYQPEIAQSAALRMQAGITRTREQAIQTARSDALASYTDTIDSRIDSTLKTAATLPTDQQGVLVQNTLKENQGQLDALVKARAVTPERAALAQKDFQKKMTEAVHAQYTTNTVDHFMSFARAGDVDAADRALHQYITDPKTSDADKVTVSKHYIEEIDNFHQAQSRFYANDIAKIGQRLVGNEKHPGAYGKNVEADIHHMYKVGALSPEGLHSMLDQSMRNQVQAIKDNTDNQLVDAAVHGGPKLDPADKEQVKAADKYFQTHSGASNVNPLTDQWTSAVASFGRQTNIIVPSAVSQLRIGLISGDPMMAVRAAASGERIRAANPSLDPWAADPKTAAMANEINKNMHAGMPATTAYQLAAQTVNQPKEQREIIAGQYKKILHDKPDGNNKALQSALDAATPGIFSHAPPVPVAMQAEYSRLVGTYYGLNQDIEGSRALAARQLQSTWGVSSMNGKPELVKYPPERLGITPDALRADVAASTKETGFTGDPAQVHLVPNANTDSSQGRVWNLVHTDPTTGLSDVLLGKDNQPLLYHVPAGPDFAKRRQELIDQKLAAARAERAANRVTNTDRMKYEEQLATEYLGGNPQQRAMAGR